ncbi:glycosyltransferase involved in cell wall biosynthesis [Kerstersia gyiorum]|uniref:glycosyltransferase family 4 protein n=1 Tax=Kerstersia gyiorum TaxID=206506 RepID=UPI00209F30CF|nr:glycosyltransferase [Kerstersia gyiorum]MCP1714067.1 glycosyltransferase involved in cell wall biosynthesis [Kerstersia gyiorum]
MKVFYMIPRDGLGGVEQAARSIGQKVTDGFKLCFMVGRAREEHDFHVYMNPNGKFRSLSFFVRSFSFLLKEKPEVLIVSLWRAALVGLLYCFFMRCVFFKKIKFVLFKHSSRYSNSIDRLVNKVSYVRAEEIWCDSSASLERFSGSRYEKKARVISFYIDSGIGAMSESHENGFVFWGRVSHEKNVMFAIQVFEKIKQKLPDAMFYIFGPKSDAWDDVLAYIERRGSACGIKLMGVKPPNEYPSVIRSCRFYLSASLREGMAIAVVEAMQLGLVPVVTMVGEIPKYCVPGVNAIKIGADVDAVAINVTAVVSQNQYSLYRKNAIEVWAGKKTFANDFKDNVLRVLSDHAG